MQRAWICIGIVMRRSVMDVWRHGSDQKSNNKINANDEVRCSMSYVDADSPKLTHFLSCCCCIVIALETALSKLIRIDRMAHCCLLVVG
jgi:hypothetical protein